jgi:hypothetical protein
LLIAVALEKPISYSCPPNVGGEEDSGLTPDEKELVYFYRQIEHKPLQLIALKQVRTLAEPTVEADLETIGQDREWKSKVNSENQ